MINQCWIKSKIKNCYIQRTKRIKKILGKSIKISLQFLFIELTRVKVGYRKWLENNSNFPFKILFFYQKKSFNLTKN